MNRTAAFLSFILLLLGCTSQNATADSKPAIGGFCPVAYLTMNQAVNGSSDFSTTYQDRIYFFASKEALTTFKKNPEEYLPAYDGYCAYGMTFGKKVEIDPEVFSIVDGKLYLNKSKRIGKKFDKKQTEYITKADQEWAALKH